MSPIQHEYDKTDADYLMQSNQFRSLAQMVDEINRTHYVSYQSFRNYLDGRSTGAIKREAIEEFFDKHLTEENK